MSSLLGFASYAADMHNAGDNGERQALTAAYAIDLGVGPINIAFAVSQWAMGDGSHSSFGDSMVWGKYGTRENYRWYAEKGQRDASHQSWVDSGCPGASWGMAD